MSSCVRHARARGTVCKRAQVCVLRRKPEDVCLGTWIRMHVHALTSIRQRVFSSACVHPCRFTQFAGLHQHSQSHLSEGKSLTNEKNGEINIPRPSCAPDCALSPPDISSPSVLGRRGPRFPPRGGAMMVVTIRRRAEERIGSDYSTLQARLHHHPLAMLMVAATGLM